MKRQIGLLALLALGAATLYGQATRTWVSGVGDDANPCSRTAPCKTLAGAISKTAPSGEIDALDPGGFGALTITKAITIDGGGGQVASVLVSGTNAIVVAAGVSDVVIIRNFRFNGLFPGNPGLNGIRFLSGKDLEIENCDIFGFSQNGIDIALNQNTQGSVNVVNTVLQNIAGVGIRATNAQTPAVQLNVQRSTVVPLGTGATNIGIEAAQHSRVVVGNSAISKAGGDGLKADDSASSDAQMTADSNQISFSQLNGIESATGASISAWDNKTALSGVCGLSNSGGNFASFTQGGNGTNRSHDTVQTCGTIGTAATH